MYKANLKFNRGFTLIELMIVIVILAILAAIALPLYKNQTRKGQAAAAQKQMLQFAEQLERHKGRNFSFKGFTTTSMTLPVGATGSAIQYTLNITDDTTAANLLTSPNTLGQNWVITAVSSDPQNFSYLLKSSGLKCKSLTTTLVDNSCGSSICTSCEAGSDPW